MSVFVRACKMLRAQGASQPLFVGRELYRELLFERMKQRDDLCPDVYHDLGRGLVVAGCPIEPFVELTVVGAAG